MEHLDPLAFGEADAIALAAAQRTLSEAESFAPARSREERETRRAERNLRAQQASTDRAPEPTAYETSGAFLARLADI